MAWRRLAIATAPLVVSIVVIPLVSTVSAGKASGDTRAGAHESEPEREFQAGSSALDEFARAVERYIALRAAVAQEVPPLRVTDKPAEIARASDGLARAIERGRRNARQGEFFKPAIVGVIRGRLRQVAPSIPAAVFAGADDDERPTIAVMRVHARFPVASPLPTMPTAVLEVLPPLPATLEYRFAGTTLVLRDIDAAMILDFLPNAVVR